jgi:Spy/CpxP family protein refolding chaperone
MMTTRSLSLTVAVLASALLVGAAEASPRSQRGGSAAPPAGTANPDPDTLSDAQLVAMLDTYAIVQAQQQLAIADDKYGTFAARLKRLQDTRRRNQRDRRLIIQELRRLVGRNATEAPDENAVRTQLAALRAHDEKAVVEMRKAYDALDEVLTPQQQARFRLLEEVIEQRKLDLLVRARDKGRLNRPPPR